MTLYCSCTDRRERHRGIAQRALALALLAAAWLAPSTAAQEADGLAAAALTNPRFAWQERQVPGFRVYFQSGSHAAAHQDSLLARLPSSLDHARGLLGTRAPDGPIDLFFIQTRDDMAALIGGPATGFAHRAVFLVTNPEWRAFERHEVMHVVSWHAWGQPAAGTDWLQEGLAQAADGVCAGYSNETALRGRRLAVVEAEWRTLQEKGDRPSPADLARIETDGCGVGPPPPLGG